MRDLNFSQSARHRSPSLAVPLIKLQKTQACDHPAAVAALS
jgi:hypothetical protein